MIFGEMDIWKKNEFYIVSIMGPSIKDIRTFSVIFDPHLPLVHIFPHLADPTPPPCPCGHKL